MKYFFLALMMITGQKILAADFTNVDSGVATISDLKQAMACYQALAPLTSGKIHKYKGNGISSAQKGDKGFYVFTNKGPYFCEFPSNGSDLVTHTYYNMKIDVGSVMYLNYGVPNNNNEEVQIAEDTGAHKGVGATAVKCFARLTEDAREILTRDLETRVQGIFTAYQADSKNRDQHGSKKSSKQQNLPVYHYVGALHECEDVPSIKWSVQTQLARFMQAQEPKEENTRSLTGK
jgi:hypothetical protein